MNAHPSFDPARSRASDPDELAVISQTVTRLAALRRECGCALGAKFMAVALAAVLAQPFLIPGLVPGTVRHVAVALAFILVSTLTGKLTAIALARLRLVVLSRQLARRYPAPGGA